MKKKKTFKGKRAVVIARAQQDRKERKESGLPSKYAQKHQNGVIVLKDSGHLH